MSASDDDDDDDDVTIVEWCITVYVCELFVLWWVVVEMDTKEGWVREEGCVRILVRLSWL